MNLKKNNFNLKNCFNAKKRFDPIDRNAKKQSFHRHVSAV